MVLKSSLKILVYISNDFKFVSKKFLTLEIVENIMVFVNKQPFFHYNFNLKCSSASFIQLYFKIFSRRKLRIKTISKTTRCLV